jgi:hypothetical protein
MTAPSHDVNSSPHSAAWFIRAHLAYCARRRAGEGLNGDVTASCRRNFFHLLEPIAGRAEPSCDLNLAQPEGRRENEDRSDERKERFSTTPVEDRRQAWLEGGTDMPALCSAHKGSPQTAGTRGGSYRTRVQTTSRSFNLHDREGRSSPTWSSRIFRREVYTRAGDRATAVAETSHMHTGSPLWEPYTCASTAYRENVLWFSAINGHGWPILPCGVVAYKPIN